MAGKQHRIPFLSSSSRANETLKLVHADVCGPMETASLGRAKYFLLIKDDYLSYRYVYFMKHKSEILENISKFIARAEEETGKKLHVIRTDNGLEFVNKDLKQLLDKYGIQHQRSVVYTPQQNGRAEKDMRTLVEAARTLMSDNMNKVFWAEAINTVNRNGSSSVEGKSPCKLWYKKPAVNLNLFRIFGSRVAVYIPDQKHLKLDVKNKIGIFLGYSKEVKYIYIECIFQKKIK